MSPKHTIKGILEGVGLEGIAQRLWQDPRYNATISPRGRLIVPFDGYIIGSILDKGYFVGEWFKEPQLDIAAKFEDSTQNTLRSLSPRRYSGLYPYSHIDRDVEEAFKMAKQAGVPLDFVILITLIGHDRIEDDASIRALHEKWEKTAIEGNEQKRLEYADALDRERVRLINQLERELTGYIPHYVRGIVRDTLRSDIEKAVRLIFDLTRFSNELPYALSMAHQYTRDGNEHLSQTLRRIFVKNADRIGNMKDTHPLPAQVMEQMDMAFNDERTVVAALTGKDIKYVVGKELRERYGSINLNSKGMPAANMVATAFNSIFPLHYSNQTFNRHAQNIILGKYGGNREQLKQLLELAILSRNEMSAVTAELLQSAIARYQKKHREVRLVKPQVDDEVKRKQTGSFYDKVTLDGFVKDWLLYDAGGKEFIESLDATPEQRIKNYRTARHMTVVIPRFRMFYDAKDRSDRDRPILLDDPSQYNPQKHVYFTLKGVNSIMDLMPDFWALVAELKSQQRSKGGFSTLVF